MTIFLLHNDNWLCLLFVFFRLREMVLRWLPVTSNTALEGEAPGQGDSPIRAVLRSKGFVWMSNSHTTAFYWSHAGGHFEVKDEGDWCVQTHRCVCFSFDMSPSYICAFACSLNGCEACGGLHTEWLPPGHCMAHHCPEGCVPQPYRCNAFPFQSKSISNARCRWAAVEDAEWPGEAQQREQLLADFDLAGPWGDRRQVSGLCRLFVCAGLGRERLSLIARST